MRDFLPITSDTLRNAESAALLERLEASLDGVPTVADPRQQIVENMTIEKHQGY